ncbi:DUF6712 family protein [Aequorivita echinoideorum]|uniref:Uncharacterized protein n=1 Tax=Aequorivita echinoideorum TaxID=1549647 RepID=A0ABS5S3A0_9FLAO|nr:DUF6712 family protein [Aequorivita echinoideorum]MBT0607644.1 hypothetical protein [Aequorivita echinoideorum]
MSTLLNDLATFKKHVTINFDFDFDLVLPYIKKAERKHIKPVTGRGMYEDYTETPPDAGKPLEVLELLQEASSNLAMLAYTFVGIIQVSDNGFHISQNQNSTPADWWQIKDLRRSLLNTGNEAIDEALAIMEANPNDFADWVEEDGYTVFREFYVRKTQDFQKYFNIENSRQTFLKLKPHLRKVEQQFFNEVLGEATTIQIKAEANEEAKKALYLAQAAQVALTIASITNEGIFEFTPQGLFVATSEVPGEKKNSLPDAAIDHLSRVKNEEGNAYLRKLIAHLTAFPQTFIAYHLREAKPTPSPAYNTKSTLSL